MNIDPRMGVTPPQGVSKEEHEALQRVSQQFEAVFVNQLVDAMRKTVTKGGLIAESQAERVFQGMLDQQYAESISHSEELGLSKLIYEHLLRSSRGR